MTHSHSSSKSYLCLRPGFQYRKYPFRRHKTWVHEGGINAIDCTLAQRYKSERSNQSFLPMSSISFRPSLKWPLYRNHRIGKSKVPPLPAKAWFHICIDVIIQRDHLWWFHDGHRAVRKGDFKQSPQKTNPGYTI